jgi:lipopolysaccharide transport system permease protein
MESELPVKVYTPHSSVKNPLVLIREVIGSFKLGNQLGYMLAKRDIKALYRQSFLGILWAFINPIFNTLIWLFLSSSGIIKLGSTAIPYPLYIFSGALLWGIFSESVTGPIQQTNAAKSILTKINFPQEAIIISAIYQNLFNSSIKIALLVIAVFAMGVYPDWHIIFFPLGVLALIITGTTIGLLLTPVAVLYGDISKGLPFILQLGMYVTPVVFPMPQTNNWVSSIFKANPLTSIVVNTRNWVTGQPSADILNFVIVSIVAIFLLLLSIIIFRIAMPILVERMSS